MVREELLEAALDSLPKGIALLDESGNVVFWNRAATTITGYSGLELLGREIPESLAALFAGAFRPYLKSKEEETCRGCGVHTLHKLGHDVPVVARTLVLRDGLGGRIGKAVVFHPAQRVDALPHGENGDGQGIAESQTNLEDRLETVYEDFTHCKVPFGVLWIDIDQAAELRKSHGDVACENMLLKVERAMANGLRSGEELGRWGKDELLAICYARTTEMLAEHGQTLAGLARTADFRWWGDRISITVSIGAAQVEDNEALADLLDRAQKAMETSADMGGNHVTWARGRNTCSPS